MTGPRLAREKSMLRYLSATAFFIELPLLLVCLPRGNYPNDVRIRVRVYDHQQLRLVAQPERDEPLLFGSVGILPGQREGVIKNRCRLREADAMGAQVRLRLPRMPLEPHEDSVWTFVLRGKRYRLGAASGLRVPGRRALTGRRARARGGDLLLDGVASGELALGLLVPAARVVEVALEYVHDAVQPRGQRRGLLLDDLVGGLPVAGFQQVEHAGRVHGASIMPPRSRRRGRMRGRYVRNLVAHHSLEHYGRMQDVWLDR